MLYQLITKGINFASVGKIGIYLSFLNLLTKEAKHRSDPDYEPDLKAEMRYRNILHGIAVLWTYRRQKGRQGTLKLHDIYRTLEGKDMVKKAAEEKYKTVKDCQFLSHSYFGADGDQLHFQHQSFAEILMAEYYLKVFIKYGLDAGENVEKARARLYIGEPTEQTAGFFGEILRLLKDTVSDNPSDETLEKRKLLFPLMCSLATEEYNSELFCPHVNYRWYDGIELGGSQGELEADVVKTWPIGEKEIERIVELAKQIMESSTHYLLAKGIPQTVVFRDEVLRFEEYDPKATPPDVDRWLALLAGNTLFNDEAKEQYFAGTVGNVKVFFDMIKNWNNYASISAPKWGRQLFRGIDMSQNETTINGSMTDYNGIDFSYCRFKNLRWTHSVFFSCIFRHNSFEEVQMIFGDFYDTRFEDIRNIKRGLSLHYGSISPNIPMPYDLACWLDDGHRYFPYAAGKIYVHRNNDVEPVKDLIIAPMVRTLKGLITYVLEHGIKKEEDEDKHNTVTMADIQRLFEFGDPETASAFYEKLGLPIGH